MEQIENGTSRDKVNNFECHTFTERFCWWRGDLSESLVKEQQIHYSQKFKVKNGVRGEGSQYLILHETLDASEKLCWRKNYV